MNRSQTVLHSQLKGVFHQVISHFHGKTDKGEHWQMPPPNYNGNQTLRDDCDGFCLACRVLLRKLGIASRLVYCEVEGAGHLVVEAEGWILDNRQQTVVANTLLANFENYRWKRISGFEARDPWREII